MLGNLKLISRVEKDISWSTFEINFMGGVEDSLVRVLPDEFRLKSVVFKFVSKDIRRVEQEYMNIHPPPPPNYSSFAPGCSLCKVIVKF